jgi:hypothetical protein
MPPVAPENGSIPSQPGVFARPHAKVHVGRDNLAAVHRCSSKRSPKNDFSFELTPPRILRNTILDPQVNSPEEFSILNR